MCPTSQAQELSLCSVSSTHCPDSDQIHIALKKAISQAAEIERNVQESEQVICSVFIYTNRLKQLQLSMH